MISEDGLENPPSRRKAFSTRPFRTVFHAPAMIGLLLADTVLILLHAGLGFLFLSRTIATFPDILRIEPSAWNGRMVFMMLEGGAIAIPFIFGWSKASRTVRRQIVPFLLLLGGAAFCAAVMDFLHTHTPDNSIMAGIFGILEDGGEMIFLSLTVSYAAGLLSRARIPAV